MLCLRPLPVSADKELHTLHMSVFVKVNKHDVLDIPMESECTWIQDKLLKATLLSAAHTPPHTQTTSAFIILIVTLTAM